MKTIIKVQDKTQLLLKENFYYVEEEDLLYSYTAAKGWKPSTKQSEYNKSRKNYFIAHRNVKLLLQTSVKAIKTRVVNTVVNYQNKVCVAINRLVRNGELSLLRLKKYDKSFPENICKPVSELKGYGFTNFYSDLGFPSLRMPTKKNPEYIKRPENMSAPKRGFVKPVYERIQSIFQRFKGKHTNFRVPYADENCTRLHSSQVVLDKINKTLAFYPFGHYEKFCLPPFNERFKSKFSVYRNGSKLAKEDEDKIIGFINDENGGNLQLVKDKVFYNVLAEFSNDWLYSPTDFIGFDINKKSDSFLTFSKPIFFKGSSTNVIKKSDLDVRIAYLEGELKRLNKLGSKIRGDIKSIHKKLVKLYLPIIEDILSFVEKNKLCICIDNLKSGAKNGSFGQDKVVKIMIKVCEKRRIPFVLVPTPYTTQLCNCCNYVGGKIPLDVREFNCKKCDIKHKRDENAAKNIENIGRSIWYDGLYPTYFKYLAFGANILKHK